MPEEKPQRSIAWAISIILIGWAVLAVPIVLTALVSYMHFTSAIKGNYELSESIWGSIMFGTLALSMATLPVLIGFAVMERHRGLRIGAITTGALITAIVAWMISRHF